MTGMTWFASELSNPLVWAKDAVLLNFFQNIAIFLC